MAYWWVSQNQTFKEEFSGGYLWAPKKDKAGRCPHHWKTMFEVRAGDVIFSYVDQSIAAISVAQSAAQDNQCPTEFKTQELWQQEGWKIVTNYQKLEKPLHISELADLLKSIMGAQYSPLTSHGTGNQGYLFRLNDEIGKALLERIDTLNGVNIEETQILQELSNSGAFDPRSIEDARCQTMASIYRRRGQPAFRKALMDAYGSCCVITGCDVPEALEAAHIYPYKGEQTNHVTNGLLLRADLHTLFDLGLIAIDSNTFKVVIAPALKKTAYTELAGQVLRLPADTAKRPSKDALDWHMANTGI